MKFAVAAGILAQTLPALSEDASKDTGILSITDQKLLIGDILQAVKGRGSAQSNLQHRTKKRGNLIGKNFGLDRQDSAALKNTPATLESFLGVMDQAAPCDPTTSDADVGILSCGEDRFCKPAPGSELGGLCSRKNQGGSNKKQTPTRHPFSKVVALGARGTKTTKKQQKPTGNPCDPSTSSTDIGILACGTGEFCREDERSELGGFCVSTTAASASRHLYSVDKCDPASPIYDSTCDCSALVNGTGIVTCIYEENYVFCEDITASASYTYTFEDAVVTASEICYEFTSPYYQKLCLGYEIEGTSCSIEFNGVECNTCEVGGPYSELSSFDCTNVEGGGTGDASTDLIELLPILGPCYVNVTNTTYYCSLCAEGDYMAVINYDLNVTIAGAEEISCQALALAEFLDQIPEYACPAFSEAAQNGCCEYQCSLCGPYSFITYDNYDTPVDLPIPGYEGYTCGDFSYAAYVNFSIPDGTCAPISAIVQQSCCEEGSAGCSICGGEMAYPMANLTLGDLEVPCSYLEVFLNSTECDIITPIAAPICCGVMTSSMSPSVAPAPGPTEAPAGGGPTEAPAGGGPTEPTPTMPAEPEGTTAPTASDGATILLPAKGAVSVFALAVATALLVVSAI